MARAPEALPDPPDPSKADDDEEAARSTQRSPLASTTPPPLSLAAVRAMAMKPNARVPVDLLAAMHLRLVAQGGEELARELEVLFDLETGVSRAAPTVPVD